MKRGSWILKMVVFGVIAITVVGLITQLLWNWLVPVLFAGPQISIWQAFGLLMLSKILLWPLSKRYYGSHGRGYWRPYWKEKWSQMTDEEKELFRKKMREKCSWGNPVQQEKSSDQ